jgi:hypothetical protein
MGRKPEVFVRSLEPEETQRLVKTTRPARDRVRLRPPGIRSAASLPANRPRWGCGSQRGAWRSWSTTSPTTHGSR